MFVSPPASVLKINFVALILIIAIVILELSILDIQTMLPFMVKTHLVQVKTTLPPQAQIHTTIQLCLTLICIAPTTILVSPGIAAIMTMHATAEAEQLILLATNNLLIIPQVQAWTMKSDLLQLGPLKIHAHTNSHNPLHRIRMRHSFTTLLRTQETLELQRCLSTTWNGVALLYQVTPHIPAGLLLLQQLLS